VVNYIGSNAECTAVSKLKNGIIAMPEFNI
jgi:hypothetical protein